MSSPSPNLESNVGETQSTSPSGFIFIFIVVAIILGIFASESFATEITGFIEASRTVEVASSESGLVESVNVKVGDRVVAGQEIALLESDVQMAQLELAKLLAESRSELDKAVAELETKTSIHDHLKKLADQGFAQQKEILRAGMDLNVAKANLLARQERVAENQLRLKMAELNLQRRTVTSPVTGIVSEVQKDPGEFISPINPQVVTVLEVNPIVGVFQINVADVNRFHVDRKITVNMDSGLSVGGVVDSIGVVAESETIAVRVRIANEEHLVRSGQRCYIELPAPLQVSQR